MGRAFKKNDIIKLAKCQIIFERTVRVWTLTKSNFALLQTKPTTKSSLLELQRISWSIKDQFLWIDKEHDTPFDVQLCLEWIDAMEHDPPCTLNSSYLHWIAFRRLVILIDKQSKGCLDHWTHYNSFSTPMPQSEDYCKLVTDFRSYLEQNGYRKETARSYSSTAREFLIYLESNDIFCINSISNKLIADYFISDKCNHLSLPTAPHRTVRAVFSHTALQTDIWFQFHISVVKWGSEM